MAKHVDITYAIQNMRYFAGWADKNQGKTIEVSAMLPALTHLILTRDIYTD